jgi:hypothetical protein
MLLPDLVNYGKQIIILFTLEHATFPCYLINPRICKVSHIYLKKYIRAIKKGLSVVVAKCSVKLFSRRFKFRRGPTIFFCRPVWMLTVNTPPPTPNFKYNSFLPLCHDPKDDRKSCGPLTILP